MKQSEKHMLDYLFFHYDLLKLKYAAAAGFNTENIIWGQTVSKKKKKGEGLVCVYLQESSVSLEQCTINRATGSQI